MEITVHYLNKLIAGVSLGRIAVAFGILFLTLAGKKLFDAYIRRFLRRLAEKTKSQYDDLLLEAVGTPVSAIILMTGSYAAIMALKLPDEPYNLPHFLTISFKIAFSSIIVWTLLRLSNLLSKILMSMFSKMDKEMACNFAPLITQAIKITTVTIGVLVVIQNLGYSIGSILAGLGIGGLAVALAAQDTLANLFGTFVMIIDRPFKVGDWVQFRDIDGNVESIGFRSTKVRTWSKSLKILPNKLLTSEIIENWSEMPKRRVKMSIGITYQSPPQKVLALRDKMECILRNDPGVDQDYILVFFNDFAPSSLEIFVYYFTKSIVWKEYLEVRQRINIAFMNAVAELGLSFAYPSQSLYFSEALSVEMKGRNDETETVTCDG